MNDQAHSLRQLKKLVDKTNPEALPSKDELLASIPHPTPFQTTVLVVPDKIGWAVPPLQNWILGVIGNTKLSYVWDQAGILAVNSVIMEEHDDFTPTFQSLETSEGILMVIPRIYGFNSLNQQSDEKKIRFSKNLMRVLGSPTELIVTLQAHELDCSQPLLHASDVAGVLIPDHQDSILRCYEALKSIYMSGYFSPIFLLALSLSDAPNATDVSERILTVAKQFLPLDLRNLRVVLSGIDNFDKDSKSALRSFLNSPGKAPRDFLYSFVDRILYPPPGDIPQQI